MNADLIVRESIQSNSNVIIKDFQDNQLQKGFLTSTDGTEKRAYYKFDEYSAFKKYTVNPNADGFVDLKYTGDFYKGMYLDSSFKGFRIDSSDSKTTGLKKKYGNIMRASDNTVKRNWNNTIKPNIINKISSILGL